MNQQEIFTKVKTHLLTQMQKSKEGHSCKYRGPNGSMCAVGCLIPDELYSPDIEGRVSLALPFEIIEVLGEENQYLLRELQVIHDSEPVEQWGTELREVATAYNLEF